MVTEAIYETKVSADGRVTSMTVIENREVEAERLVFGSPEPLIDERLDEDGIRQEIFVHFDWSFAGVTRPNTGGIMTGWDAKGRALAARLAAATRAGVVFYDSYIKTDVAGQTFVTGRSRVMGKYLNADLRRLGF